MLRITRTHFGTLVGPHYYLDLWDALDRLELGALNERERLDAQRAAWLRGEDVIADSTLYPESPTPSYGGANHTTRGTAKGNRRAWRGMRTYYKRGHGKGKTLRDHRPHNFRA